MSNEEKKNILGEELHDEDLEAVVGGSSDGCGGCYGTYYKEKCTDTVERGSWCWSGDWCNAWSSTYTQTDDAYRASSHS